MRYFLFLYVFFTALLVNAQQDDPLDDLYNLEPRTADCLGAVDLPEKLGPVIGNNKIGAKYEIKKQKERVPYMFAWEHNVVWYKFTAEKDGLLHLLIIPEDPSENFDFMIYGADGPWFCSDLDEYLNSPLTTNVSSNPGVTGLSDLGTEPLVTESSSNTFSQPLKVQNGITYYLVIDSPDGTNSGHSIEREIK
ncbi:MAG: hypothetical protein ACPF8V_07075 [Luteibaculum sp.]